VKLPAYKLAIKCSQCDGHRLSETQWTMLLNLDWPCCFVGIRTFPPEHSPLGHIPPTDISPFLFIWCSCIYFPLPPPPCATWP